MRDAPGARGGKNARTISDPAARAGSPEPREAERLEISGFPARFRMPRGG